MKKQFRRIFSFFLVAAGLFLFLQQPQAADGKPLAYVVEINGPITPATYDLVHRNLAKARQAQADIVVLEMQTPGGLYDSMQQIIQDILDSPVPVAAFVSPPGSRAASAGTYILYASQVAAMAPSTNIGAATPINMLNEKKRNDDDPEGAKKLAQPQSQLEVKMVNDACAYIRGLAQRYGRNGDWAEKAVRDAESLTASEALAKKAIDLVADDVPDLLNKIDGRTVTMAHDRTMKLVTKDARIVRIKPDWRTALLDLIANPNLAFLLMTIGSYGLIYECLHPGAVLPGVAGAVCLLLGLFALNVLPINYAGLALMLLGIGLMAGEAFAPSFGALGIGGAVSFAMGATMLIDATDPGFAIDPWMIAGVTLASLAFFSVLLAVAIRAQRRPAVTGVEELKASIGEVLNWSRGEGDVRITGEIWKARAAPNVIIGPGDRVRVVEVDGLRLVVKPEQS